MQKKFAEVPRLGYFTAMETTQESVKRWLAARPDRDRYWLAAQCETEKKTVDNWLSSPRGIPAKAALIIGRLMRADLENAAAKEPIETMDVPLRVTVQQFDSYSRAHKESDCATLRDWMISRLDAQARAENESGAILKVAEDDPGFHTGNGKAG